MLLWPWCNSLQNSETCDKKERNIVLPILMNPLLSDQFEIFNNMWKWLKMILEIKFHLKTDEALRWLWNLSQYYKTIQSFYSVICSAMYECQWAYLKQEKKGLPLEPIPNLIVALTRTQNGAILCPWVSHEWGGWVSRGGQRDSFASLSLIYTYKRYCNTLKRRFN